MGFSIPALDTPRKRRREHPDRRKLVPDVGVNYAGAVLVVPRDSVTSRLRRQPRAMSAVILLGLVVLLSLAAPLVSPYAPDGIDFSRQLEPPSLAHPAGTDELGRDVFVRLAYGGRTTLRVALLAMGFAVFVGVAAGALAGYRGGAVDFIIMRTTDAILSIPIFLVVLLLSSVLVPTILMLSLLIGVTQWVEVARVVRSVVMGTKERTFVEAAKAIGVSSNRVLFRHILPHTSGTVLVAATLSLAYTIVMESAMSFLGFGVKPPTASWGVMLQNAQSNLATAPWLAFSPGLMIFLTVYCCYILGDFFRTVSAPGQESQRG